MIKSKLSKKSRSNKPKHRDDADFESAVPKKTQVHDPRELQTAAAAAAAESL